MKRIGKIYNALKDFPWMTGVEIAVVTGINERAIHSACHNAGTTFSQMKTDACKSIIQENADLKKRIRQIESRRLKETA